MKWFGRVRGLVMVWCGRSVRWRGVEVFRWRVEEVVWLCLRCGRGGQRSSSGNESSSMSKRQRCRDADGVFEVLRKYVKLPSDVQYREELAGKADTTELVKHAEMLNTLMLGPCPNGSLTQKAAADAFGKLAEEREEWHLGADTPDFVARASRRLRSMMRDAQQALLKARAKGTCTNWVKVFLSAHDADPSAPVGKNPKQPVEDNRVFGWDDDTQVAWRTAGLLGLKGIQRPSREAFWRWAP